MQDLKAIEVKGKRVLTTKQLAESYGTTRQIISNNYTRNRERYIIGKHVIPLEGEELREFKGSHQIDDQFKFVRIAYLWTEKGALLHAKSLNTDKAWEVYDYLVDFYFRVKEAEKREVVPAKTSVKPMKEKSQIPKMGNPILILKNLLSLADEQGVLLQVKELHAYRSCLRGNRIEIHKHLPFEAIVYEAAYELAHHFIHYNDGNIIDSPLRKDYDDQAERAANMIIMLLNQKILKG